jgi:hypothetical protein
MAGELSIHAGEVQRVLFAMAPQARSITHAAQILADHFGLTPETLRCYAAAGVPARSKAKHQFIYELKNIKGRDLEVRTEAMRAEQELAASLDRLIEIHEKALRSLRDTQKALLEGQ